MADYVHLILKAGQIKTDVLPHKIQGNRGLGLLWINGVIASDTTIKMEVSIDDIVLNPNKVYKPVINGESGLSPIVKIFSNSVVPLNPFLDGRGVDFFRFVFNKIQANDIIIGIPLISI